MKATVDLALMRRLVSPGAHGNACNNPSLGPVVARWLRCGVRIRQYSLEPPKRIRHVKACRHGPQGPCRIHAYQAC
jgi:hypothetical protein